MDTCPTSIPKRKGHMSNDFFQNKHVVKERRNTCGMVGDYKCKGGHGAKALTWLGQ
jgi:hypothetical protein